jgi:hypothetical protein
MTHAQAPTASLQATMAILAQAKPKADEAAPPEEKPPEVEKSGAQMAFWPEEVAAMPTELTRTALFPLVRRGKRKMLKWEKIDSRQDVEIRFFGEQLDQADADLWLACLRMGRGLPMGQRLYTNAALLLREIGRADDGRSRQWLTDSLKRMSGAAFEIKAKRNDKKFLVTTGMLKFGIEETSRRLFIRLDPDGARLFENLAYVDWEQRKQLSSNMAKALQMYVCGHARSATHKVRVKDLAGWMGYEGRLSQFLRSLRPALTKLETAGLIASPLIKSGVRGDVASWVRS